MGKSLHVCSASCCTCAESGSSAAACHDPIFLTELMLTHRGGVTCLDKLDVCSRPAPLKESPRRVDPLKSCRSTRSRVVDAILLRSMCFSTLVGRSSSSCA
eukprot:2244636-Pleurochrysis_carterae.AAC.2